MLKLLFHENDDYTRDFLTALGYLKTKTKNKKQKIDGGGKGSSFEY